jgi:hypothetical protein
MNSDAVSALARGSFASVLDFLIGNRGACAGAFIERLRTFQYAALPKSGRLPITAASF